MVRIPAILRGLEKVTVEVARRVEEGERKAELERKRCAAKMERCHCEEAEIGAEKVLEDSKKDLLVIIEMWAISKRLEAFFADAERRLENLPEVEREHAMENVMAATRSQADWRHRCA